MIAKYNNYRKKEEGALKCIQSLYKNTYQKNAFSKNSFYKIDRLDNSGKPFLIKYIYIIDNEGRSFTFTLSKEPTMYFIGDYFDLTDIDSKIELTLTTNKYNL